MEAPNEKESDRLQVRRCSSSSLLAMAGAKASRLESLDYEINESDLLKQDELLQCVFLKWALAFLVGFLTGAIAFLINFAIENIAGRKMLLVARFVEARRYLSGFLCFAGMNLGLTATAAFLGEMFAPTAAGPGIPEIKAYLNGVDTPNFFGASTLILKQSRELHLIDKYEFISEDRPPPLHQHHARHRHRDHVGRKGGGPLQELRPKPSARSPQAPGRKGVSHIRSILFCLAFSNRCFFLLQISPVVGILTKKDLRAQKLLAALPQFARKFD